MTRQYQDPWDRHGGGYSACRRIAGQAPCPCIPGGCDQVEPEFDQEGAAR